MVRPLVISGEQIKYLASMREVIDAVEDSFRELALGNAKLYTKQKIYIDELHARFMAGSAFVGGSFDVYGTKLLGSSRDNPVKRGLPTRSGVVVLNDSHSGEVLAIIDGTVLTAVRTAACAAVAARYMARKDAETAGVFGVGAVGRELIRAFCAIRNIKTMKVIDPPSPERCKAVCKEASEELGIDVTLADDPKEVVVDADIIGTATTSPTPLFEGEWLKEGAHISSVACARGRAREIDDATIKRVKKPIVADAKDHILLKEHNAKDLIVPIQNGLITKEDLASLGDLILGKISVRTSDNEITLFKTCGLITEDVISAYEIFNRAKTENVGTRVTL